MPQDEQGAQETRCANGTGAELGEDPSVLEMGKAVPDRRAPDGKDPVGGLSGGVSWWVLAGLFLVLCRELRISSAVSTSP
ncbi:hypothetical protein ABZ918_06520 [Streptomyces viridosporus]|uniref:hypothetical protein n=1 Tax=Streptomyces viridosporus TaxID=67581 RepID=UPI003414F7E3